MAFGAVAGFFLLTALRSYRMCLQTFLCIMRLFKINLLSHVRIYYTSPAVWSFDELLFLGTEIKFLIGIQCQASFILGQQF